jgi:hypothetical protein
MSKSVEYAAWANMNSRAGNLKLAQSSDYVGRGIAVCKEWRSGTPGAFEAFYAYIGPSPGPKYSVDRYPNNDGNYEPGNVRWATRPEQARNKRNNRRIVVNGETRCLTEWCEMLGLDRATFYRRMQYGWSEEDALLTPVRKRKKRDANTDADVA